MTPEQAAWYLAAMIDGEGCVYYNGKSGRHVRRCVQVTNSDTDLLDAIEHAAGVLGFTCAKRVPVGTGRKGNRKPCWCIRIAGGQDAFVQLRAAVPLQSSRKRARLDALIAAYKPKPARPTPQQLHEQYVGLRWTIREVARFWGVEATTVRYWMQRDCVRARTRAESKKHLARSASGRWLRSA